MKTTSYGSAYPIFYNFPQKKVNINDLVKHHIIPLEKVLKLEKFGHKEKENYILDDDEFKIDLSELKNFIHHNKIKFDSIVEISYDIINKEDIICQSVHLTKDSLLQPKYSIISVGPFSNNYKVYSHFIDVDNFYCFVIKNVIGKTASDVADKKFELDYTNNLKISNLKLVYLTL
jgi:hypothetical protein